MSPTTFAILAWRLLGVYFCISSLPLLAIAAMESAFSEKLRESDPRLPFGTVPDFIAFFPAASTLAIGVVLIAFAPALGRCLAAGFPAENRPSEWTLSTVAPLVFASVGLLIFTDSLPELGSAGKTLYEWCTALPIHGETWSGELFATRTQALGIVAQFAVGLLLILSPRGFAKIWKWARTAGTQPRSEPGV